MRQKKQATLGLIAVVRDEEYFILEWLWFHRLAGIEHFYLEVQSTDGTLEKIKSLPFYKECITVYEQQERDKVKAYQFLMDKHKNEVKWMILADVDEFFFYSVKNDIKVALKSFEKLACGGILVPWTQMGLNGHVDRPPLPITDHLVLSAPHAAQTQYKVIVKTEAYTGCSCAWCFDISLPYYYQGGTAVKQQKYSDH